MIDAKLFDPVKPFMKIIQLAIIALCCYCAYDIRTYAIKEYGRIIHEFDPWFNFRATQYLADNGWDRFSKWYDYMSWSPLGRPIGTTIYPGMQIAAVQIWRGLNAVGIPMSLNDVCVFFPCWFGVIATLFTAALAAECSGDSFAAVPAAAIMSIIPAHTMRSVGGGYDNESLAVTTMVATFYFWCRSLRNDKSWMFGILAGFAYICMVAAWGGYIFVLNMVGVHAIFLVFIGRFSLNLHRSYSLWYIIGTIGAIQFPVVGLAPLRSMEQLGPMGVFFILQLLAVIEYARRAGKTPDEIQQLKVKIFTMATAAAALVVAALIPTGYFGPLSVRVRGLFVEHTKTGNPLVDSVAEHQPASSDAYFHYLHHACWLAPIGYFCTFYRRTDAKYFLTMYASVSYYFSNRMVRLIIFLGPIASALGGLAIAYIIEYTVAQFISEPEAAAPAEDVKDVKGVVKAAPKKVSKKSPPKAEGHSAGIVAAFRPVKLVYESQVGKLARKIVAVGCCFVIGTSAFKLWDYSHMMAQAMSQPSVMFKARLQSGEAVMVDDYLQAYYWVRDNTPQDARVMAWWDYGYQITGIANRTSIADGNTWHHEHIANLARSLTATPKRAHEVIRHLADYVLVWTGGGSDDMAKSPHIFRIGASIGSNVADMNAVTSKFGIDRHGNPTPQMAESLLFNLVSFQGRVDESLFKEVYTSKYRKVRVYEVQRVSLKSKRWAADPANRICDAPGSWYCDGQYPPALKEYSDIIKSL